MPKILYSPGYGAGWSSWNHGSPEFTKWLITYQPIIDALELGERLNETHPIMDQLKHEAKQMFGEDYVCVLGADDLVVCEVSGPFRIDEYDGSESVTEGTPDYITL